MADKTSELNLDEIVQSPLSNLTPAPIEDAVVVPAQEMDDDIISITIKDDELPDAVLKAVLLGLSEEQQALRDLRVKKATERKDTSHISLKRGTLLKYMSETLIQRQALVGGSSKIDLRSPKFREVIKMFLSIISRTFDEVNIPLEYRDLFFQSLASNLDGWEVKAEKMLNKMG